MGEVADDMIDGTICSLCGCFFHDPIAPKDENGNFPLFVHGYPVVCEDCWKDMNARERKNYQKALKPTI